MGMTMAEKILARASARQRVSPGDFVTANVDKLAGWIGRINTSDETRKFLHNAATDVLTGTPESMAALLKQETERWATLVKLVKIEPQ